MDLPLLARKIAPEAVFLRCELEQLAAEFPRQQDHADFAFEGDFGLALPHGFHCDIADFADPDAGGADGFHQEREGAVARGLRRSDQPLAFPSR